MIVREFREAWRRLARRRGYALLSVAVLGAGLGVTLFLFSLVNTLILDPLPALLADPGLHTQAHDLRVFAPVLLTVLLVALIASLMPLTRALRVDPAIALRYE
jgi:putative ABC transport system permease protein